MERINFLVKLLNLKERLLCGARHIRELVAIIYVKTFLLDNYLNAKRDIMALGL